MSTYSMAQIVALTGIKAHTLRKWETRYTFLTPERTDTNIRYYTDEQLKRLLNIGILTRNGFRISKIDKMSDAEINDVIAEKLLNGSQEDDVSILIICTLKMDEVAFEKNLNTQIAKKGLLNVTTQIIYPFLAQIGILWGISKVIPAQEHFISNLIKKKMFSSISALPYPKEDAPVIVMFLTENEQHEIGLLLAYFLAMQIGWKVYYLGQNVPTENIKQVVDFVSPKALLTMFITPNQDSVKSRIEAILSQISVPLLVSGNPEVLDDYINDNRINFLSHPDVLINTLADYNK